MRNGRFHVRRWRARSTSRSMGGNVATDLLWLSAETPGRDGGGGQRRQYHQIRALCESGVSVVVAALAGPQDDSSVRALTSVHRFPASRRRPGRKNPSLERLIEVVAPR